jgi:hypothetical protein
MENVPHIIFIGVRLRIQEGGALTEIWVLPMNVAHDFQRSLEFQQNRLKVVVVHMQTCIRDGALSTTRVLCTGTMATWCSMREKVQFEIALFDMPTKMPKPPLRREKTKNMPTHKKRACFEGGFLTCAMKISRALLTSMWISSSLRFTCFVCGNCVHGWTRTGQPSETLHGKTCDTSEARDANFDWQNSFSVFWKGVYHRCFPRLVPSHGE